MAKQRPFTPDEEWFTWLRKCGIAPVELVRFPRASHVVFASQGPRLRRIEPGPVCGLPKW